MVGIDKIMLARVQMLRRRQEMKKEERWRDRERNLKNGTYKQQSRTMIHRGSEKANCWEGHAPLRGGAILVMAQHPLLSPPKSQTICLEPAMTSQSRNGRKRNSKSSSYGGNPSLKTSPFLWGVESSRDRPVSSQAEEVR